MDASQRTHGLYVTQQNCGGLIAEFIVPGAFEKKTPKETVRFVLSVESGLLGNDSVSLGQPACLSARM